MTNIYTHFNFLVFAFYHKYHIKCIYSKGSFHNLLFDVYNIYYAHQISHRHTAIRCCDSHPPFVTPLCRLCMSRLGYVFRIRVCLFGVYCSGGTVAQTHQAQYKHGHNSEVPTFIYTQKQHEYTCV